MYKFILTGPYILTAVDDSDPKYLKLSFSDGYIRKMSKGGNWPSEYAISCLSKARALINSSVYIKTSQTTRAWKSTEWLCDIQAEQLVTRSRQFALEIAPEVTAAPNDSIEKYILTSCTSGKTYFANAAPIVDHFSSEDDFIDFCKSFEQGFVSAWSAKSARNARLPFGVKRVRISGLGNLTKRNGFRVVAAEIQTDDTSEAFKFFHILRVDEKLDREEYLSENEVKVILQMRRELEERYPKGVVSWMND